MPTNYWLKFGNTPLGYNGSGVQFTHVEQPGTLTVSLTGTGTGFDNAKNFNVLVTFGSAISYTVDGTPVATPSATCTLTLHAGQSKVIGNIPFGTTYVISENVTDEGYALVSITNSSGTMTDGGAFSSVVTNVYHAPGTLTITSIVSGTGFDTTKKFSIVTTFGRAISYTINGTPVSSPSNTYTARLAHNQSVVIGNIPSGVSYSVAESTISQQDYSLGYTNGSVVGGSGTMTDAGSKSATANYTYDADTAVIGGTRYKTATIGGKVWMAENLDYKYSGLTVGSSFSGGSNRANYPNNSEATYGRNGNKYGLLYNRVAMLYLEEHKSTLIPGWHVPTWDELSALITAAGGASVAGKRLKSTSGWSSGNGTDNYGFKAVPTGYVANDAFRNIGSKSGVFSVTPLSGLYRILVFDSADSVATNSYSTAASDYYPIRLVKD